MVLQNEGISYHELMTENEQYLQQISEICRELDALEEEGSSILSKDVEISLKESMTSEFSNGDSVLTVRMIDVTVESRGEELASVARDDAR